MEDVRIPISFDLEAKKSKINLSENERSKL
jgi:hypothetical protein